MTISIQHPFLTANCVSDFPVGCTPFSKEGNLHIRFDNADGQIKLQGLTEHSVSLMISSLQDCLVALRKKKLESPQAKVVHSADTLLKECMPTRLYNVVNNMIKKKYDPFTAEDWTLKDLAGAYSQKDLTLHRGCGPTTARQIEIIVMQAGLNLLPDVD